MVARELNIRYTTVRYSNISGSGQPATRSVMSPEILNAAKLRQEIGLFAFIELNPSLVALRR
jgi:hypothetical protein